MLTGSSNFLTVPTISESLAGRAGLVEVWPFTRGEISGKPDRFVEHALAGPAAFGAYEPGRFSRPDLLARVCTVKCKFMTGIALYAGNDVLPFGDRFIAAPISSLWDTLDQAGPDGARDIPTLLVLLGGIPGGIPPSWRSVTRERGHQGGGVRCS